MNDSHAIIHYSYLPFLDGIKVVDHIPKDVKHWRVVLQVVISLNSKDLLEIKIRSWSVHHAKERESVMAVWR